MSTIIYKDESFALQGAIFEVYKEMGAGFLESVYQECLEIELSQRNIPFQSQKELDLFYKKHHLKQKYIPDFICYGKIIVEIKAIKEFTPEHEAQLLNYLKATKNKLGLLVNFSSFHKATVKRMVL